MPLYDETGRALYEWEVPDASTTAADEPPPPVDNPTTVQVSKDSGGDIVFSDSEGTTDYLSDIVRASTVVEVSTAMATALDDLEVPAAPALGWPALDPTEDTLVPVWADHEGEANDGVEFVRGDGERVSLQSMFGPKPALGWPAVGPTEDPVLTVWDDQVDGPDGYVFVHGSGDRVAFNTLVPPAPEAGWPAVPEGEDPVLLTMDTAWQPSFTNGAGETWPLGLMMEDFGIDIRVSAVDPATIPGEPPVKVGTIWVRP